MLEYTITRIELCYEQNNKKLKHDKMNISMMLKLVKIISRLYFLKAIYHHWVDVTFGKWDENIGFISFNIALILTLPCLSFFLFCSVGNKPNQLKIEWEISIYRSSR